MKTISIVSTGVANLASVTAAFTRLGTNVRQINQPDEIDESDYLVLPGVGTFAAAMAKLNEYELVDRLYQRIQARRPTLMICLGMQLLFETSEENPGVNGIGIIPGEIKRLKTNLTVPQMGWNSVIPQNNFDVCTEGYAYFANSYGAPAADITGWETANFDYGNLYIAALQSGNVIACQFHPELSGAWGQTLIQNWMERAA